MEAYPWDTRQSSLPPLPPPSPLNLSQEVDRGGQLDEGLLLICFPPKPYSWILLLLLLLLLRVKGQVEAISYCSRKIFPYHLKYLRLFYILKPKTKVSSKSRSDWKEKNAAEFCSKCGMHFTRGHLRIMRWGEWGGFQIQTLPWDFLDIIWNHLACCYCASLSFCAFLGAHQALREVCCWTGKLVSSSALLPFCCYLV